MNWSWLPTMLAVPLPAGALAAVSVSTAPISGSVSFAKTLMVRVWFSVPAATSATATGASLVPVMVMVRLVEEVAPKSSTMV